MSNAASFDEDTYDVAVGARYAISRHLSAEIGYTHTTVDSSVNERSYDRNRVLRPESVCLSESSDPSRRGFPGAVRNGIRR